MKRDPISDLIRRVSQAMTAAYMKQEPGLTLPQTCILRALMQKGPVNQTQLRLEAGIDRSTAASMLNRMARAGMLVNVRMESDKRALLVSITPAGRAALLKADGALAAAERELVGMVPRVKRPYFKDGLQAIVNGAAAGG